MEDISGSAIIGWIVAIVATVFFTRFVFSIDTITENLRDQTRMQKIRTRLLLRMAEKAGVSQEDINESLKSDEDRQKEYVEKVRAEKGIK